MANHSSPMHGRLHPQTVGLGFEGVVLHHCGAASKRVVDPSGALLENVRQFMAKQLLPLEAVGVVIARSEVNVGSPGKGNCADAGNFRTNMDANIGKITA